MPQKSLFSPISKYAFLLFITFTCSFCLAEYFSSVERLNELGEIEVWLAGAFRKYIDREEKILKKISNFLEHIKAEHKRMQEGAEEHWGNPVNVLKSINRMVTDWTQLGKSMTRNVGENVFSKTLRRLNFFIPGYSDLRGTVMSVVRLQKVYNLQTSDLVKGIINGIDYETELKTQDCYEIAKILFQEKELSYAIAWFKTTFKLATKENDDPNRQKLQINSLVYLALANSELGYQEEAKKCIKRISKLTDSSTAKQTQSSRKEPTSDHIPHEITRVIAFANFSRLCQGIQLPEKVHHTLRCHLETKGNPVFILAPLKKEEVSLDPEITVYHDVLNDANVAEILRIATDMGMERSSVLETTGPAPSEVRISQHTWLFDGVPIMKKIKTLLNEMTRFNMSNSEAMQVLSYASGGLYEPHNDALGETVTRFSSDLTMWQGDRIATNIFYFSNVEQGGFTVFPYANAFVRPEKGSLVTWHNLHRSLVVDTRLLHAGCPVIKGSKRIGTVWIHSGLQEFARPCGLTNDAHKSIAYGIFE